VLLVRRWHGCGVEPDGARLRQARRRRRRVSAAVIVTRRPTESSSAAAVNDRRRVDDERRQWVTEPVPGCSARSLELALECSGCRRRGAVQCGGGVW